MKTETINLTIEEVKEATECLLNYIPLDEIQNEKLSSLVEKYRFKFYNEQDAIKHLYDETGTVFEKSFLKWALENKRLKTIFK